MLDILRGNCTLYVHVMRVTTKNISLTLLAALYFIAAMGASIGYLSMYPGVSGPVLVKESGNGTKKDSKPGLTTQRYVPMVKEVSNSYSLPVDAQTRIDLRESIVSFCNDPERSILSFFYSSLSNRAPPHTS